LHSLKADIILVNKSIVEEKSSMRRALFHISLFSVAVPTQAIAAPSVSYAISPVFEARKLTKIVVTMTLNADASGRTVLELPDKFGGVEMHHRFLSQLDVARAVVSAPTPSSRIVISKPKAKLHVRYSVRTAYEIDPDASAGNLYDGAVVRPDWFASLGEFILVIPKGEQNANATMRWMSWPKRWRIAASKNGHHNTVDELVGTSFLAGPKIEIRSRAIDGGTLRFASHGHIAFDLDAYADRLAAVVSAQRRFWGKTTGDYSVTLLVLAPSQNISSSGGTGRTFGFVQYASPDTDQATLFRTIAHEHVHNWIPRQLGTMPENDALAFWLSEGFTDFYTSRTLLRGGFWTPQQFIDNFNLTSARLANSPAQAYPNERIGRDFWSDVAVEQLPYDRGHIFAHLLDASLRSAGKQGLDEVIFAMRDRWLAAPIDAKPEIVANLIAVLDSQKFDVRPMLKRHIEDGLPLELPTDLFGKCSAVSWAMLPAFDVGFDRDASAKAGVFANVDPNGPAYAAGLRNGMKRIGRLAGEEGNAAVLLSYRVREGSITRVLSWLPAGRQKIRTQQASTTSLGNAGCAALFLGVVAKVR
jgi:predicted metalloprotease with PDZ domain